MATHHRDALDRTFLVSIVLKGMDGLLEIVAAAGLFLVSPVQIQRAVAALTRGELAEDPGDFIANALVRYADQLSTEATTFGAIYFLVHGVVKVAIVAAVLRGKVWAFPWLIVMLAAFVLYQGYLLVVHPTVGMVLLTLFDLFVIWLTVLEYRRRRAAGA